MRLFKRRKDKGADFWDQPAMVPTTAGEAAGEHASRARRWRRLVKANFIAFPFVALALVMLTAQFIIGTGNSQDDATGDGVPTAVRAEAIDVVGDWINSSTPPLNGAKVIGWDGATKLPWPKTTEEKDRTYDVWVAHVLVSTDTALYRAGVQVSLSGTSASVVGTPSLEMIPPAANSSSTVVGGAPWPGTTSVSASDAVTRAVQAWAQAYVSGDQTKLTTVVADPDTSHAYLPVSGFTNVTATVNGAAYRAYGRGEQPDTSLLMANVTLAAARDGLDKPAQITFDLLISDPTTGSARVTAWGATGSGPTLTPYANAVGSDSADTKTASPTPSGTASPTASSTAPAPSATPTPSGTATRKKN